MKAVDLRITQIPGEAFSRNPIVSQALRTSMASNLIQNGLIAHIVPAEPTPERCRADAQAVGHCL